MGKMGKEKQVRFSEVHIYSNNFRSSFCFSRNPRQTGFKSKMCEDIAKLQQKGQSDPKGTLLTNIEGTEGESGATTDIIASKLVIKPFPYFLVLSISSQAIVDAIVTSMDAFIADVEVSFQELPPEMQQVLKMFGASSNETDQENRAINLLLESPLQRFLQ